MPSKSPAQRRFMAAAAHNPAFAKKAGMPQSVAKEYAAHDEQLAKQRAQAQVLRRGGKR